MTMSDLKVIDTARCDEIGVTCKPLDIYKELLSFSHHPSIWRSLCIDLEPHSKYLLRNCELVDKIGELDKPPAFCHFNPKTQGNFKLHEEETLRKTLVCHDAANGYLDDSVVDGTGSYDVYTFYNWAGIDILFCYFTHHLITIPPLAWINVGHKHGVKVIGTIITEWTEGISFWTKVLSSESEMTHCIDSLVAVAKTLKFDGWLLNVENKVTDVDMLLKFVKSLHTTMHKELKDPLLIWYDSVTIDGMLNWQNKLNTRNKNFFEACDGFFTNYSWTVADVEESVLAAGPRLKDLYIGIDVWGRNFYGGGKFNTQEVICPAPWYNLKHMNYQPNAAHGSHGYQITTQEVNTNLGHRETKGIIKLPDSKEELPRLEENTSGSSTPEDKEHKIGFELVSEDEEPKQNLKQKIKQFFKRKSLKDESNPEILPSSTSVISSGKSMLTMDVNIQLAPSSYTKTRVFLSYVADEIECLEVFHEDSFIGGTCLKINPPRDSLPILTTIRLFHCDFFCKESAIICVVTKNLAENLDQYLNVYVYAVDQADKEIRETLVTRYLSLPNAQSEKYPCIKQSNEFKGMQKYIMLNHPEFFVPFENFFNWNVFYFEVSLPNVRITSINCRTGMSYGSILLGHFGLCHRDCAS